MGIHVPTAAATLVVAAILGSCAPEAKPSAAEAAPVSTAPLRAAAAMAVIANG